VHSSEVTLVMVWTNYVFIFTNKEAPLQVYFVEHGVTSCPYTLYNGECKIWYFRNLLENTSCTCFSSSPAGRLPMKTWQLSGAFRPLKRSFDPALLVPIPPRLPALARCNCVFEAGSLLKWTEDIWGRIWMNTSHIVYTVQDISKVALTA
jgi:hypothetical protein